MSEMKKVSISIDADKNWNGWYVPLMASLITFLVMLTIIGFLMHNFVGLELTTTMSEINQTFLEGIVIP